MAGIYLHIPFCKQACYYCDFHFSTNRDVEKAIVGAMLKELGMQKGFLEGESVETIYFGGGTPSLLDETALEAIIKTIRLNYAVEDHPEITLEANPDDLTSSKLEGIKKAGINRLSIGMQAFDDGLLSSLNRSHNTRTALDSFQLSRKAGITNISIDLIYAIPGLSDPLWMQQLEQALALAPEHISCYSLTIEDKTAFGHWAKAGKFKPVDDDVAARQLERTAEILQRAGYQQYEISNFAKEGFYSRHNTSYWKQMKYLGIGPGAHSYDGTVRKSNVRSNPIYIREILKGRIPAETEVLTTENKINEYLLTTLRTMWGSDLSKIKQDYNVDVLTEHALYIHHLVDTGLATVENEVLTLLPKGKLVADKIAADLFVVEP